MVAEIHGCNAPQDRPVPLADGCLLFVSTQTPAQRPRQSWAAVYHFNATTGVACQAVQCSNRALFLHVLFALLRHSYMTTCSTGQSMRVINRQYDDMATNANNTCRGAAWRLIDMAGVNQARVLHLGGASRHADLARWAPQVARCA